MSEFVIRPARIADLDQMCVNGEAFLASIGEGGVNYDKESMMNALCQCISDGMCFIADLDGLHLGGIGAILGPLPLNESVLCAVERFWWVSPDERAKGVGQQLLTALRDAAKAQGCQRLIMIALENDSLPLVEKAYLRFGLLPRERTYEMRL